MADPHRAGRRVGSVPGIVMAWAVAMASASVFAQAAPADTPASSIAEYKRRIEEKCGEPLRVAALPSGDYELDGKQYTPEQLVEALDGRNPRPGCLHVQGQRNDPVRGDRMYWLMGRLQGVMLSWLPPPRELCESDAPAFAESGAKACESLPAAEFAPLSAAEYRDFRREQRSLSACLLGYQVRNRGMTNNLSDDRIQRRLAKNGVLPAMKADVEAFFPGLTPEPPPTGKLGKGDFGELQGLSWALIYRANASAKLVEGLQARALYAKFMALGTEGECRPSETFTQLLYKSKPR